MIEILNFVFSDFWHFIGILILCYAIKPRFENKFEMTDAEFSNKSDIFFRKMAFYQTRDYNLVLHNKGQKQ